MLWETATTADALSPLGTSCTQAVSTRNSTTAIRTEGIYKYDRHPAYSVVSFQRACEFLP